MGTKIEHGQYWDKSLNPVKIKGGGYHCTKCSPGCLNCWAEGFNLRFHNKIHYDNTPVEFVLDEKVLEQPLRCKIPTTYFVCDLCDLFHESVPDTYIWQIKKMIEKTPWHIYQILTKRIERAKQFSWSDNVWLGVTAENQRCADERIPILLQIPAAVRFVSCEPLLGEIDIRTTQCSIGGLNCEETSCIGCSATYKNNFIGLDWVIVGGESGPKARPMHPDWARSIRNQCQAAGVPFFFKQWGEWLSGADKYALGINTYQGYYPKRVTRIENITFFRVGKKKAGHLLDGKEYREYPK